MLVSSVISAQDLTIGFGSNLFIENGTVFNLNGMRLEPTVNYDLIGPNTISVSATPIDAQSINRVYDFTSPLSGYQGDFVFSYEDAELNSVPEANLVLVVKDVSGSWNGVASALNTTLNTLSYSFSSPTDIYGASASDDTVLSLSDFEDIGLQIYPNPVESIVVIDYKNAIEVEVCNQLGQSIFKTKNKSIDVSNLNNGVYLLLITDLKMNKKTIRKITKK